MEEENQEKKKPHRDRKSGRKAEKKKAKNVHTQELTDKQRNPKAFTFNSAVRAERQFRRAQDIQTKKQHVPVIDRTPLEPPPIMVVIVGPPKVGKTTLIQCLVKSFTKQPLTAIKGPVTVVSGKRRRITLIECNNDVNSMLDLAKVADLVLLLIDASFGFEMEIFEFLNICQVHGMPKVMGVLTHLDMLKNNKTLKRVKKTLKHRFWTEVYAGAKLFYLSGILHGEYLRNEIANLGRFISVMKFRPLTWQTTHSYVLADRMEDLTPPEAIRQNPKVDRSVSLYGFVRGIPLNKTSSVHIPGCGDMKIHDVCFLPDPCPLPEKLKKRSLVEKERLIYAPFSGVGGIVYDKDAVYIELAGSHSHLQNAKKNEPDRELVTSLMDTKETLDAKISKSTVKLFSDATPITASDFMAQSVSKKEPSGSDNVVSKSTSSSDNEILEHSDSERNSAEYEADTVKKRKRKSSDNDVREVASDPRSNVQKKFKKQVSSGETVKIGTGKSGGFMSRKAGKEEIILSDDGRTRRKVNFVVSDEELIAENDMSGDDDDDIDDVDDDDDNDDSNSDDNTDNRNMTDEDVSPADEESDDDYDNIEAKIKYWKYDSQQSNSENNEEGLSSKKKKRISLKSSVDGKQNQNVRHHASVTKRDQEVLSKISDALTRLDNSKQKDSSRNSAGKKALSDSAWSEESFGNESDSDEFVKKQQKSDNETDDDYNSDATDDENNGSASDNDDAYDSDNEDEFNDDGCLEGDDDNSEIEKEEPNSSLRWKSDIMQKARDSFVERQSQTTNLWKLVYGNEVSVEEDNESVDEEEEVGGLFKVISRKQQEKKQLREVINAVDSSKFVSPELHDWSVDEVRDIIKDCFVTGNWKQSEDAKELLRLDDMSDDELYGDFEDLETGEKHLGKAANVKSENEDDSADETKTKESLTKAQLVEKKRKLKEKFDAEYDDKDGKDTTYYDEMKQEVTKQAELNRIQFEGLDDAVRVQLEGFRAGMYVRIELNSVPCELVTNFDPTYPIIVGGLQTGEENIGFVKVRIKKHRWYKKILKTKDPIIISLGWRRFQTLPVYSKQEDNMRYRMLKYTPEHVGCMAHFWGPLTRPNTGFLAVQDVATKQAGFRIVATGSVIDTNQSTEVTKKLKLTGVPLKIYKKTAFIRGMFTSSLEVAKFEGARIKTVSGIRGQIKKAVNKPEGAFRATFEDKIQLSDIVFCRTWYRVEVPKFYNPVTSLLLPPEEKNLWRGMKTVGQLKRESGIHSEPQLDSMYKPIEREPAVFKPLSIPRKLQKKLPYKDKPKFTTKPSRIKRVAVIRDEHESKVASVMRKIRMIYQHKQQEERQAALARLKEHRKQVEAENARKQSKEKERKKQFHRAQSKKNTKNNSF